MHLRPGEKSSNKLISISISYVFLRPLYVAPVAVEFLWICFARTGLSFIRQLHSRSPTASPPTYDKDNVRLACLSTWPSRSKDSSRAGATELREPFIYGETLYPKLHLAESFYFPPGSQGNRDFSY